MVEGHGTHRVAAAHRRELVGKKFKASSPNGRFAEGAAAISAKTLVDVQCVGKNLFYTFSEGEGEQVVMHGAWAKDVWWWDAQEDSTRSGGLTLLAVHFGMSGRHSTHAPPGPASTPTTRLRLESPSVVALLSAMTVEHGGPELYERLRAKLGPDPLREDADCERLWRTLQATKRPVGAILMDQSCVAGIGNIYRVRSLCRS